MCLAQHSTLFYDYCYSVCATLYISLQLYEVVHVWYINVTRVTRAHIKRQYRVCMKNMTKCFKGKWLNNFSSAFTFFFSLHFSHTVTSVINLTSYLILYLNNIFVYKCIYDYFMLFVDINWLDIDWKYIFFYIYI